MSASLYLRWMHGPVVVLVGGDGEHLNAPSKLARVSLGMEADWPLTAPFNEHRHLYMLLPSSLVPFSGE